MRLFTAESFGYVELSFNKVGITPVLEHEMPIRKTHLFSENENGLRKDEWYTTGGTDLEVKFVSTRPSADLGYVKEGLEMDLTCGGW